MKVLKPAILLLALASLGSSTLLAQTTNQAFENIKSLEGDWTGVKPDGRQVEVSYQVMSGGSAVMETLKPVGEPTMVTVYHLDNDKLMMTHYCSAGNQPRMTAEVSENAQQIDFSLSDVTNLESTSSQGHMKNLTLKTSGKDKLTQVWTFSKDGKAMPAAFELTRTK